MSDIPVEPTEAVPVDGGPLYCRNCSTELEVGAQFCSGCGAATHAGGAEPAAATMATPVVREPVRRTTVVDEEPVYREPVGVVRPADNWWGGPFMFMAAAILVVLIVVLAVALSRDGEPATSTTVVPVATTPPPTVVPAPVIVPPPVIVPAPAQTQPPQTAPPQTQPPQTQPPQTQPPQTQPPQTQPA